MLGCSEGNLRLIFFIIFTRYLANFHSLNYNLINLIYFTRLLFLLFLSAVNLFNVSLGGKVLVLVGLIPSVISFFVISDFTCEPEIRLDIVLKEEEEDEPRRGLSFFGRGFLFSDCFFFTIEH